MPSDGSAAIGAETVRADPFLADEEAGAADKAGSTIGAGRGVALPRYIADVDEAQAFFAADGRRPGQGGKGGRAAVRDLVVGREAADVPGDVVADRGQEAGNVAQLFLAAVILMNIINKIIRF